MKNPIFTTFQSIEQITFLKDNFLKNLKTKFKVKTVNFLNLEPVGFQLNQGHRFDNANKRYNIKHSYNQNFVPLLKKVKPNIYHYRCAYGLESLDYAKRRKIITVCDHTICHPRFLWTQLYLDNPVKDPFQIEKLNNIQALSMNDHFKLMERDLNIAENILTDCDLVKKTCVFYIPQHSKTAKASLSSAPKI